MNKSKILVSLFLILIICIIPFGYTKANSFDFDSLDPESLITMPSLIYNGAATIDIHSSVTDYTLFYQSFLLTESDSSQFDSLLNAIQERDDEFLECSNRLQQELNALKELYNSASLAYEEGLKNEELSEEELEALKTSYETAKTNYQNKNNEYQIIVDEYEKDMNELVAQISSLVPLFEDENWTKTNNNNIEIDLNQFSGKRYIIIWAKLVTSDETHYDMNFYTINGLKDPSTEVSGISLNKTKLSLVKGSSFTLKATVSPSTATDKTVIWKSDNENIATVVDGKVTAKSAGTTTITATSKDGNYSAVCKVTVTEVQNSENEDSETNDKNEDTTTATGKLPQTGISNLIIFSIIGISILGIISYKTYKHFNF